MTEHDWHAAWLRADATCREQAGRICDLQDECARLKQVETKYVVLAGIVREYLETKETRAALRERITRVRLPKED